METTAMIKYEPIKGGVKVIEGKQEKIYSFLEKPEATSFAVEQARRSLKTRLNIEKIGSELENCIDLLEVAYYAVNGISKLQSSVSMLQSNLLLALGDSVDVMENFRVNTELIIKDFFLAYKFLNKQNSQKALEKFKNAEKYALEMVDQFQVLRDRYRKLAGDAAEVTRDAAEEKSSEYKNKGELIAMRNQMEAEMAAFESLKKSYVAELEKLEREYSDLNKKLEKAEDRQFALELTGIIVKGLGTMAEGIMAASIYGNGKMPSSSAEDSTKDSSKKTAAEKESSQTGTNEISKELAEKQKKKDAVDAEVTEKKKTYDEAQKNVEACNDEQSKDGLKAKRDKALNELTDAKERQKLLQATIDKLQEGCNATGDACQKAADSQSTIIENYNVRIQKVFELRNKIKEKEIENLSNIAKYTKTIADSHITEDAVDLAIKSLIIAITCMRNIEVILNDMVDFWSKLAAHCKELGSSGMEDYIELAEGQDLTQDVDLVQGFFAYLVNWTVLELVAEGFLQNVEDSKSHLRKTIAAVELSREKAWEKAPKIAEPVFKRMEIKLEKEKSDQKQGAEN